MEYLSDYLKKKGAEVFNNLSMEAEETLKQQNYKKEEAHLPQNPFGNTYKELQQELNERKVEKELNSNKNIISKNWNIANIGLSNNFEKILNDDYSDNYYRFILNDNEDNNNFYGIDTINKNGKIFSKELPHLELTEDKDNIIITDTNTNKTYKQSKQWQTKETTLKEQYTEEELKQMKQERIDWFNMSDEEWNKYINKKRTYNNKLSNFQAQKIKKAIEPFSEDQINNIKSMGPVGLQDYIMATREQEILKDIREQAILHYREGKELTEEELYSLQSYAIYNANINLRGISFAGKLLPGVMTNLGVNTEASLSSVITDLGVKLILAPIGGKLLNPVLGKLTPILGTGKLYKTAKFTGQYLVSPLMKGTADYLLKTTITDKLNLPFGSGSIEEQYRDKRLNKILEFTDKGTLTLKQLTNDDEEFLKTQTKKETFIEAYTERALDPFFDLLGGIIDNRIKNGTRNWWWRTLRLGKKINDLPRIAGTTFDGLLGEHSEELLGIALQHLIKANDPDTTLSESLKEYIKPENLTLSTLNIWIAGGLFRQMTNAITGNKNNQQTEPLSDNIIRKELEAKNIDKNYIQAKLDVLTPQQKDKLAERIVLKETKKQQQRYEERLNTIKDSVKEQYGEETANNYMAILDSMISSNAINFGVSRQEIIDEISLKINNNINYDDWIKEKEERKRINEEIRLEQASYKNSRTNIKEFIDYVNSNEYKENNKQTYQDFNIGNNTNLRLMNNTIEHTNKHNLTSEDYENLLNNINNIKEVKYNNRTNYIGNNNLILDIETPKGEMGVVLTIGNNNNYITTAFYKTNTNLWNEWWNKEDNKLLGADRQLNLGQDNLLSNIKLLGAGENTADSQDNLLSNIIIDYRKNNVKNNNYNQTDNNTEPKLIMGTATSINNLDSIIKNNGLISPSFAITTINNEYLKENNFGDIFFIRNPQYINYKEDNIYDRDIWSPRQNIYNDLYYEVKGILNPISNYDMENIKRFINENNIEAIKRNYSLDDADIKNIIDGNYKEKLFMGFNERTGDRIYKDLNNKTLLQNYKQQLKESPFLGGERYNDDEPATSLEHLLSFYSNKQKNKKELKKTGKEYLTNDRKESNKKYGEYELEYEDILNKIEEELGYTPTYETLTNLYDYGFLEEKEEFDEDLIKEFKDFIDKALKLPRDYFEAKPIKEIPLNEFSYIIAPKNKINEKQKQQLESKGITIKEYESKEDKINILNELYKKDTERVYFQTSPQYTKETININGKERTVYNSNNERIANTEEELRNFYKWFGNSKVVDKDGRPLIVYHGTINGGFATFKKNKNGIWFSDNEDIAGGYGYAIDEETGEYIRLKGDDSKRDNTKKGFWEQGIYETYLKLENPLIIDFENKKATDRAETEKYKEEAERNGNDGYIIKNIIDNAYGEEEHIANDYIVFNPNQIKSIENKGTYNINDDNIYNQTAYHGSPYNFDKFTLDHIGKGEGAQAHGWGLYFALDKKTAEGYRDRLNTGINNYVFEDNFFKNIDWIDIAEKRFLLKYNKNFSSIFKKKLKIYEYKNRNEVRNLYGVEILETLYDYLDKKFKEYGNIDNIIKEIENINSKEIKLKNTYFSTGKNDIVTFKKKELLDFLNGMVKDLNQMEGRIYQVNIPEDNEMLFEGKTFKEQPKEVQEKLKILDREQKRKEFNTLDHIKEQINLYKNINTEKIYNYLINDNISFKEARLSEDEIYFLKDSKIFFYDNLTNEEIKNTLENEKKHKIDSYEDDLFYYKLENDLKKDIENFENKQEFNSNIENVSNKNLYEYIKNKFNLSQKETSLLLNKYGIKGIRYNGNRDGECAVVFNDNSIRILEYLQSQNINNNNNNINNNNVLDLTEEFKELNNITNGFEINNLLKDIIENLRGEEFKTKDNNIIKIDNNPIRNKKGDDHIVNKAKGKNQETRKIIISITQKLKEAILEAIEDKTRNGEITEETLKHNSQETQEYKKNNFNKFFYFNIPVKIDNNNIKGILTTVSYKENNKENKERDKKFLYEISIEPQGMIQGVQDNYNSNLFNSQEISQNQPTIKGNIDNSDPSVAVINLFKNKADQSTLLHETAHYFLELIRKYADKQYPIAETMIEEIKEWTATFRNGVESLQTMHERFARGFEQYVRSGKYDNPILKNTYDYFKDFLLNIYKNAEELNIDVNNPQMFSFFDKYIFAPSKYTNDNDWVYYTGNDGEDDDKNKKEEEDNNEIIQKQLNIINNSNSLTELTVLDQGTEAEELREAIRIRINALKKEGYTEEQMKADLLMQDLVKSWMKATKKVIDNMEATPIEDIKKVETINDNDKYYNYKNNNDNDEFELIDDFDNKEDVKQETKEKDNNKEEEKEIKEKKENKKENNKNNQVKSSVSQSRYKQQRMNNFIESYNKSLSRLDNQEEYNKQLNILNEYYELKNKNNNEIEEKENENKENINNNTEKTKEEIRENEIKIIRNNLNKFIDKIFSKEIQEETEYINKIFREKNEIRKQIEEEAKFEGVDYGIHPYKNIQEMLTDFEIAYNNLTYRQKKAKSNLLDKETEQGESVNQYTLSYDEYDKIVNFRKKYLKEQINKLNENINKQNVEMLNLNIQLGIEKATNQANRDLVMKYQQQIEDLKNLQTKLGANINTLNEVEEAMGIIRDTTLRDKILKYSSGGHSAEYVKNKIEQYKEKELKKDYQKMIDNILLSTIHISKRTGKLYGETIYEDSGFFKELKAINKYSKKEAEKELLKLESDRASGINTEPQKHYELKKQLLYFKATDKIDNKFMGEILNNLGDFTRESKELQQKIKTDNLYNTVLEKKRIKELIDKTKTTQKNNKIGLVSHFGNLKTILEFIGGKEMAKKMDMLPNEMLYTNSIKEKQDNIFNKIFDIVGEDNIEKVFKEFSQPVTEVQYKRSKEDTYNRTYSTIELKTSIEELKLKIVRAIENMEDWNGGYLIGLLDSINPSFQGGSRTYYKYRISNNDVENLLNIINHIQYYSDNTKELEDIEKTLNKIEEKEYKTDIEDYKIDLWGVMQYDLQKRNETTKKLIERYYTKETIDRLEEIIKNSPKEFKEIENILFEAVQDREELNPYYIMEFNRDMGRVSNYFPRRSLHENEINLFDTLTTTEKEKNKKVSAIENRSYNAIPNFNVNPLSLTMNHIQQTEYIKNIAVKLKNISNIFDTSIKDYITEKKGKDITNALIEHLDNLKNTIPTPSTDTEKLLNYFISNWANSVTNTPSVLLKQATSFIPYMEGLNPLKFLYNYFDGIIHFNKTKNFMKKLSPYINYRLEKNKYKDVFDIIKKEDISSSKQVIDLLKKIPETKDKILNKTVGKIPVLNKLTKNSLVEIGDILSVIYGGYARYKTNIDNGMSEIEAIADFEKHTAETQQSDFKSLQTREVAKDNNFFSRIARMFKTQQGQYYNKKLQRDIERINKEISFKDRIINIILYNLISPFIATLMSSLLIPKLYGRRKKDIKEMFNNYWWAVLMSFTGFDLIKQTGILTMKEEGIDLIKNHLTDIQGAITGMPIDIFKIMFNRPYEEDLYDSEKEQIKKAKRIRREERRKNK